MRVCEWDQEIMFLMRYAGSGAINTVIGIICIFSSMALGLSPVSSNVIGYCMGFVLGFVFSRRFTFCSNGHFLTEGVRYLISFLASFSCNLLILKLVLFYGVNPFISQFVAAFTFSSVMYILSRLFVFDKGIRR